jgi:hypothetical protein
MYLFIYRAVTLAVMERQKLFLAFPNKPIDSHNRRDNDNGIVENALARHYSLHLLM